MKNVSFKRCRYYFFSGGNKILCLVQKKSWFKINYSFVQSCLIWQEVIFWSGRARFARILFIYFYYTKLHLTAKYRKCWATVFLYRDITKIQPIGHVLHWGPVSVSQCASYNWDTAVQTIVRRQVGPPGDSQSALQTCPHQETVKNSKCGVFLWDILKWTEHSIREQKASEKKRL